MAASVLPAVNCMPARSIWKCSSATWICLKAATVLLVQPVTVKADRLSV